VLFNPLLRRIQAFIVMRCVPILPRSGNGSAIRFKVYERLGHATIAITLDTYSHAIPGMGNHAARAIEEVFSQSRPNYRQGRQRDVVGSPRPTTFYLQMMLFQSGAEGSRTPDLRRAKAARYCSRAFRSLQNRCKRAHFLHDTFPKLSGHLLGLLHQEPPSRDVHRICTRLHIYAALPPVVIKSTETVKSGVATEPY
jgi:hypothetical protein